MLAVALLAVAAAILPYALRTAWADWLAHPELWLGMGPGTVEPARYEEAARWAPGEASYPGFSAMLLHNRARATADPGERLRLLEQARERVDRAIALRPTAYRFWWLAGAIEVTRALTPGLTAEARAAALQRAVEQMREAAARFPNGPLLHQQAGAELLRAWRVAGEPVREATMQLLVRSAQLQPSRLRDNYLLILGRLGEREGLELLPRATPSTAEALLLLGDELRRRLPRASDAALADRMRTLALGAYRDALAASGLTVAALQRFSAAWRALADADEHRRVAAELRERFPRQPIAWLAFADALAREERTLEVRRALDRAVRLAREATEEVLTEALRRRADFLYAHGDPEAAISDYDELAAMRPGDVQLLLQRARCLDRLEQPDRALAAYEQIVKRSPRWIAGRYALAQAYAERFEWLEAIKQWRAIAGINRNDLGAQLQIARAYERLGLRAQAVRWYRQVLERDPDNAAARQELARLLEGGK